MVGTDKLTQEVPYLGGKIELAFFVEGLRFPDKDFDGLVTINLSLLEPCGKVSESLTQPRGHQTSFFYLLQELRQSCNTVTL